MPPRGITGLFPVRRLAAQNPGRLGLAHPRRGIFLVISHNLFKDADAVEEYVVFNIRRNRYRLVTIIHCSRLRDERLTEGHVYVRSFLRNFAEVRHVFKDADAVEEYVIFNIRRNRYRLVTIIHYSRLRDERLTEGHVYVRSFLTHKEYDNPAKWDQGVPR
ncbi:MAG: hypothetical protein DMG22_13905 [Acidobacteria bacterium]|nr:MAG: hypothetical protein DMG22_13905 [Acidobacteriota bacterium]